MQKDYVTAEKIFIYALHAINALKRIQKKDSLQVSFDSTRKQRK